MSNEQDLKIGDCFPTRKSLIDHGFHNVLQRGMGSKKDENGIDYIFSIVLSNYPDNEVYEDDIYYTGEGSFDAVTGRIYENQTIETATNKKMLRSISRKIPIIVFRKSSNGYCFIGSFVPTHYIKKTGRNSYTIIDFHLKRSECIENLLVSEETKEVHVTYFNDNGKRLRKMLSQEEITAFYGLKILDKVGDKKIYNIVN